MKTPVKTTLVSEKSTDRDSVGTSTETNDLVAYRPEHAGTTDSVCLTVLRLRWANLNHSDVEKELATPLIGMVVRSMHMRF